MFSNVKKDILISLDCPFVSIFLIDNRKKIDKITWKDDSNLSLNLLKKIDSLLSKNKLEIGAINKIKVNSEQTTYSSIRIAKIVARTTNYFLTNC